MYMCMRVVLINILELQFDLQTKIPDFAPDWTNTIGGQLFIDREREREVRSWLCWPWQ